MGDNYMFLIKDVATQAVVTIDPGCGKTVDAHLNHANWQLSAIWNTHHHDDHTGGNMMLKEKYRCTVYGSKEDRERIPGIDRGLKGGDTVKVGNTAATVLEVPGHTKHHIAYWFE